MAAKGGGSTSGPSGGSHGRPAPLGAVGRALRTQRCKGHRQRAAAPYGAPLTQTALPRSRCARSPSPHRVSPPRCCPDPVPLPAPPAPSPAVTQRCPQWGPSPQHRRPLRDTVIPPLPHPQGPHAAPLRLPPPGAGRRGAGAALSHAGCLPQADIFGKFQRKHFRRFQQNGTMGKGIKALFCLFLFFFSSFFFFFVFFFRFSNLCRPFRWAPAARCFHSPRLSPLSPRDVTLSCVASPHAASPLPTQPCEQHSHAVGGGGGLSLTLTVTPCLRCSLSQIPSPSQDQSQGRGSRPPPHPLLWRKGWG